MAKKADASRAGKLILSLAGLSRVVEMAWEGRTPFVVIELLNQLSEPQLMVLMRKAMAPSSFRMWRQRASGQRKKHARRRNPSISRANVRGQYERP